MARTQRELAAKAREMWIELSSFHIIDPEVKTFAATSPRTDVRALAAHVSNWVQEHPDDMGITLADVENARCGALRTLARYFWGRAQQAKKEADQQRFLDSMHLTLRDLLGIDRSEYDAMLATEDEVPLGQRSGFQQPHPTNMIEGS